MEYFYKMQRLNDEYKIVSKKNNNQTYTNDIKVLNDLYLKYDNLNENCKQTKNADVSYLYNHLYVKNPNLTEHLYQLFNINDKESYLLINTDDKDIFYLYKWWYKCKLENINSNNKCIKYIETNYLSYTKLKSSSTIAIFKKKREDDRMWNFHKNF